MRTFKKYASSDLAPPYFTESYFVLLQKADIDRFDSSQTVRTMMLCFVFFEHYITFSAACQGNNLLFTKNSHLKLVCFKKIHFRIS